MKRALLPLLLASSLPLCGCVASLAASAVGAAVRAATPERPTVYDDLRTTAQEACRARAAPLGQVHIIDADQVRDGTVTVWGVVEDAAQRRSFECTFRGTVRGVQLRPIRAPQGLRARTLRVQADLS